jgi:bilirubin oxidase
MLSRRQFVKLGAAAGAGMLLPLELADKAFAFALSSQAAPLDTSTIPKFVDRLPIMNIMPKTTSGDADYAVKAVARKLVLSSGMADAVSDAGGTTYTGTDVFCYRPAGPVTSYTANLPVGTAPGYDLPLATYLGGTFAIPQNTQLDVKWINALVNSSTGQPLSHPLPVDPSVDWANPNLQTFPTTYPVDGAGASTYSFTLNKIPIVTHLHGAEAVSHSDGGPHQWFTPDGVYGPDYSTFNRTTQTWSSKLAGYPQPPAGRNYAIYRYYNKQQPTTLWYHDHTMGMPRLARLSSSAAL